MAQAGTVKTSRRDVILRAAAQLFARRGIAETNLRQIARKARISNGTLHYHFPSKDKLVETLILTAVAPLGRQAWQIAHTDEHVRRQLDGLVRLAFELFDFDWNTYYVALLLGDHLRTALPPQFPTATEPIAEIVRRGQGASLVRDRKPLMLAILCHGIILRVPRARTFNEIEAPISQYVDQVVDACWRVPARDRADL